MANLKIVVLDSRPLDAGDLDWQPLHDLGEVTLHADTSPEQVQERVAGADVVYTNKVRLPAALFDRAAALKMVGVLATGYDVVDIAAARRHEVVVCNVPAYSSQFTAQTTWALLLELTHHVALHAAAVREGEWQQAATFSFWKQPLIELSGKTMTIVGVGRIGGQVARVAGAMDMEVLAALLPGREAKQARPENGLAYVPLEEALRRADVVSLHCPLTGDTHQLINSQRLAWMKASTLLVNTSRGALVDAPAVAQALQENRLGGYATDVLEQEPPPREHPLLRAPRCVVTPHLAWASLESRQRLLAVSIENLRAWLRGEPQNQV